MENPIVNKKIGQFYKIEHILFCVKLIPRCYRKRHCPKFCVKSSENTEIIERNYDRSLIYDRTNRLAYSEFTYRNILPLDFELSSFEISDPIAKLFAIAYFYYTLSSIFDFSSFANNHINYKINGFKTREFTVSINLADLQISIPNVKILSEIYNWIYLEG